MIKQDRNMWFLMEWNNTHVNKLIFYYVLELLTFLMIVRMLRWRKTDIYALQFAIFGFPSNV
jgi:hypothetical protein